MSNENNAAVLRERLSLHFQPTHLEVIDDSHAHRGHAAYQGGGRHFSIIIAAKVLSEQSRVCAHRQIYAVLADLIPDKVHALQINIIP